MSEIKSHGRHCFSWQRKEGTPYLLVHPSFANGCGTPTQCCEVAEVDKGKAYTLVLTDEGVNALIELLQKYKESTNA